MRKDPTSYNPRAPKNICPDCGATMVRRSESAPGWGGTVSVWKCPSCGYREKIVIGKNGGIFDPR